MIPISFGLLVGCESLNLLRSLPSWYATIATTLGVVVLSLCIRKYMKQPWANICLSFFLALAGGISWSLWVVKERLNVPVYLFDEQSTIRGHVISAPALISNRVRFDFKLTELCDPVNHCEPFNGKVKLFVGSKIGQDLQQGDELAVMAQLQKPIGLRNPGGKSKAKQYFLNGFVAEGKVLNLKCLHKGASFSWRTAIKQRIIEKLKDSERLGIFLALVVGDQSYIADGQWAMFRATGTSHLMAISGLHIGLVASFCYYLGLYLWGYLCRRIKASSAIFAGTFAIVGALIYAYLAGGSIPTQRACLMVGVVMLGMMAHRWLPKIQVFVIALLLVLIWDPLAVHRPGFWLSFGAVILLLMIGQSHAKPSSFRKWILPQILLFFGMLPLSLCWFEQASLMSPLANLIAIPWMSFLVVPGALLGSLVELPFLSQMILELSDVALKMLCWILETLNQPWSMIHLHLSSSSLVWILIGAIFMYLPKGLRGRSLLFLAFAPIILPQSSSVKSGDFLLHVLDVGQGTSIVVETQNHLLVYDYGGQSPLGFDAGSQVLNPFLRRLPRKKIDLSIISHADKDHYGGFDSVAKQFPINQSMTSNRQLLEAERVCRQGDSWQWDGISFEFLHPSDRLPHKKNNQSCVLKISTQNVSALVTGDIESIVEDQLVAHYGADLQSNILIVPHHGSKTSSSQAFIEAVSPQYAIITAGRTNAYHHPHASVVQRYLDYKVSILKTFETGAICFKVGKILLSEPRLWATQARKIWDE